MTVSPERSGWRDESISRRHRQWGFDCPAVDLDFIMLEFDGGKVACLVEYKNEHAAPQKPSHPSIKAIADLATKAEIPFIGCRYATNFSWWKAAPLNLYAKTFLPHPQELTETEWVRLLYFIRGRELPVSIPGHQSAGYPGAHEHRAVTLEGIR